MSTLVLPTVSSSCVHRWKIQARVGMRANETSTLETPDSENLATAYVPGPSIELSNHGKPTIVIS